MADVSVTPAPCLYVFDPGGRRVPSPGNRPGLGVQILLGYSLFVRRRRRRRKGPKVARLKDRAIGRERRSPRERTLYEARGVCTTVFEEAPVGG